MQKLTVQEVIDRFNLKVLYHFEKIDLAKRKVNLAAINRGGLELTGYKPRYKIHERKIMLLSTKESEYIASLKLKNYQDQFSNILENDIPVLLVSERFTFQKQLCQVAKAIKSHVPIFEYQGADTADFISNLSLFITEKLSPQELIHGSLVNIFGYGVLIIGDSGIGKSETTLDLIRSGHLFIGDDSINIFRIHNKIIGKPNELVKNFIEIRGIGILDVTKMYGYHKIMHETPINLVINLIVANHLSWSRIDRIGSHFQHSQYFGVKVPLITIPVTLGRNLADLIESAVISVKLKAEGQNAFTDFEQKVIKNFKK